MAAATAGAAAAERPRGQAPESAEIYQLGGPVNADVYHEVDALYDARRQPNAQEKARARLEDALKTSPGDAGLLWRYGRARVTLGEGLKGGQRAEHFAAAEQSLRAALDLDSDMVDARYWLAMLLFRRGRYESALTELDATILLAPKDARLYHLTGDVRWRAPKRAGGDRELAVWYFERAVALSGNDPNHYVSLADAYSELGRPSDAAKVREKMDSLGLRPSNP